jgi:hypothetical protein
MKISPISSWQNGQEKQGTEFNLRIINDDLSTFAQFYYSISTEQTEETISQVLVDGNLTLSGADYQTWDSSVSANEWAYNWAATQLKLTITGEYIPPTPPEPTPEPSPFPKETIA